VDGQAGFDQSARSGGLPGLRHSIGLARSWHRSVGTLWLLNGVAFYVLRFATGWWQRLCVVGTNSGHAVGCTFAMYRMKPGAALGDPRGGPPAPQSKPVAPASRLVAQIAPLVAFQHGVRFRLQDRHRFRWYSDPGFPTTI